MHEVGKKMTRKRNGKIELLRFLFCLAIILFHINNDLSGRHLSLGDHFTFFKEGRIAVEFFFIVTGYLAAAKAYKMRGSVTDGTSLGKSTWDFIKSKIITILPYHFIFIGITTAVECWVNNENVFRYILNGLPCIFLLQMSGLPTTHIISVEWYISSMLIVLLFLYPLCVRFYNVFTRIIAPVLGVTSLGVVLHYVGALGHNATYVGAFYAGNIRAIGGICLGMFSFELFRTIRELESFKRKKFLFTLAEALGYGFCLLYMISADIGKKHGGIVAVILCVAVGITFSDMSYGQSVFNNRLFYFLGKCSVPVFLAQNILRALGKEFVYDYQSRYYIAFVLLGSIILGIAIMLLVDFMKKISWKARQNRPPAAENNM